MTKTIQVNVDDKLKESADELFASLGLDTSTAIRMFLIASMEEGGIPFKVKHRNGWDLALRQAIARRKSGKRFYSIDECIVEMDEAIAEVANDAAF